VCSNLASRRLRIQLANPLQQASQLLRNII
jgi:hypothetical protein